jgi:AcrR family transcriptional regulator
MEGAGETQDLGRRHRDNTRARLIGAARKVFFEQDYARISIDRIAREAGFTRATFYLHFASKDDLIAAMMLAESHRSDAMFRWFERDPPSPASITGFIAQFLGTAQASRTTRLFHSAALQSDAARAAFLDNRQLLMALLGQDFPAFRPVDADSGEAERAAAATLAMVALEQLSLHEHAAAAPDVAECMVRHVENEWLRLHERYPSCRQAG